jgi:hypothetical protein
MAPASGNWYANPGSACKAPSAERTTMETYSLYFMLLPGAVLALVGLLWWMVRFFRGTSKRWPTLFLFVGLILAGTSFLIPMVFEKWYGHDPRKRIVDGDEHLTLTDSNLKGYDILDKEPDTVVLQMANADVTDDTLKRLAGMKKLRELDLNFTQVTDAGLEHLKANAATLQQLRLMKTKITDEGFKAFLDAMPQLKSVDVSGTAVKTATLRKWKNADKENRSYVN